jgi:hypothetical protein
MGRRGLGPLGQILLRRPEERAHRAVDRFPIADERFQKHFRRRV